MLYPLWDLDDMGGIVVHEGVLSRSQCIMHVNIYQPIGVLTETRADAGVPCLLLYHRPFFLQMFGEISR